MPTDVAFDSSFILGLLDVRDIWHTPAVVLYSALNGGDFEAIVFDCVMAEVISTLARRTHEKRRSADIKILLRDLDTLFPSRTITWLYPDLPLTYNEIVRAVEQSNGELNFNDALIAHACRQRKIPLLASFDADFDRIGWLKRVAAPSQL